MACPGHPARPRGYLGLLTSTPITHADERRTHIGCPRGIVARARAAGTIGVSDARDALIVHWSGTSWKMTGPGQRPSRTQRPALERDSFWRASS